MRELFRAPPATPFFPGQGSLSSVGVASVYGGGSTGLIKHGCEFQLNDDDDDDDDNDSDDGDEGDDDDDDPTLLLLEYNSPVKASL